MFSIYERPITGKPNPIVDITVEAQAIIAELVGSNASTAAGITVVDHAPVLALCRALVTAGQDPNRPLHAYRGDVALFVCAQHRRRRTAHRRG